MAQKQKRRSAQPAAQGNASGPLLLALAAGLAGFFWWKSRQQDKDISSGRSPFRFPGAAKAKAPAPAPAAATSSLPRNKASNNKKNKARKKEKRAEKEAKPEKSAAAAGKATSSGGGDEGQASTAVVNYTYFDSARRDTVIPLQKRQTLSAADVMQPAKKEG